MSHCTITTCGRPLRQSEAHRTACSRCEHRIRGWLREIVYQLPLLTASLQRDGGPVQGSTASRAHSPAPLRLDVLNLLGPAAPGGVSDRDGDQGGPIPLLGTLRDWASAIADERGKPLPARPGTLYTGYLAAHLPYVLTRPWIRDLYAELGELMKRIRGITRTEPRSQPLPAPCPGTDCTAFGLVQTDWQVYIECTACGRLLTRAEYDEHAARVLPPLYRIGILIAANLSETL